MTKVGWQSHALHAGTQVEHVGVVGGRSLLLCSSSRCLEYPSGVETRWNMLEWFEAEQSSGHLRCHERDRVD